MYHLIVVQQIPARKTFKSYKLLALYLVFLSIYLLKIRQSMLFIPADPGVDYLVDANRSWLKNLFILADGQLVIVYKLIANLISVLSPQTHALAMGVFVAGLWALGAVFITRYYSKTANHLLWSMTIGLLVILVPAASESQLGNIGGTRWLLYLVVALVISNTDQYFEILTSNRRISGLAILILLLGLSNPLAFALLPGLAMTCFWKWRSSSARASRFTLLLIGLILFSLAIQLFSVISTKSEIGRKSTATYLLWDGVGLYWKFILFSPVIVIGIVLCLLARNYKNITNSRTILLLCVQSTSIYLATYVLAGIADRYLIAPYVLSFAALIVLTSEIGVKQRKFDALFMVIPLLVALFSSILWFSANSYLTSGLSWSNQINDAIKKCSIDRNGSVQLVFSDGNPYEVPCDYILSD
jgi:hypothetical protein